MVFQYSKWLNRRNGVGSGASQTIPGFGVVWLFFGGEVWLFATVVWLFPGVVTVV